MNRPETPVLRLAAHLTIVEVTELHQAWRAVPAEDAPLRLEADAVERIDAAGVQLLLALVRQIESRGQTLEWLQPSRALTEAAAQLGLSTHLRLPLRPVA